MSLVHPSQAAPTASAQAPAAATAAGSAARIGLFGGAFDPPHNAHVALAHAAAAQLGLTELRVVPTGVAWHKARALSAAADRLAMARLAFAAVPQARVDDRELQRAGPTFTIDTLEALHRENPTAVLYLIMGADQFAAFQQWHRWQSIVEIAIICVAERANSAWAGGSFDAGFTSANRFFRLQMPPSPISATQVRQLIASAPPEMAAVSSLVAPAVARYIADHQLYKAH